MGRLRYYETSADGTVHHYETSADGTVHHYETSAAMAIASNDVVTTAFL